MGERESSITGKEEENSGILELQVPSDLPVDMRVKLAVCLIHRSSPSPPPSSHLSPLTRRNMVTLLTLLRPILRQVQFIKFYLLGQVIFCGSLTHSLTHSPTSLRRHYFARLYHGHSQNASPEPQRIQRVPVNPPPPNSPNLVIHQPNLRVRGRHARVKMNPVMRRHPTGSKFARPV